MPLQIVAPPEGPLKSPDSSQKYKEKIRADPFDRALNSIWFYE